MFVLMRLSHSLSAMLFLYYNYNYNYYYYYYYGREWHRKSHTFIEDMNRLFDFERDRPLCFDLPQRHVRNAKKASMGCCSMIVVLSSGWCPFFEYVHLEALKYARSLVYMYRLRSDRDEHACCYYWIQRRMPYWREGIVKWLLRRRLFLLQLGVSHWVDV